MRHIERWLAWAIIWILILLLTYLALAYLVRHFDRLVPLMGAEWDWLLL